MISQSIPADNLRDVILDHQGKVWVSFIGGVARFDPKTQQSTFYGEEQGLPHYYIEGLEIDHEGNIWVATHNGAARFNAKEQKFESFDENDGFTDTWLESLAFSPKENKMYFMGKGNLFSFDLNELQGKTNTKRFFNLEFISFRLLGEVEEEYRQSVQSNFKKNQTIHLSYQKNAFELKFSALSSEISPNHTYEYKLQKVHGTTTKWIPITNPNKLIISHLNPGHYTLSIRVAGNEHTPAIRSLNIIVQTPWWQTWWFRVLFVISLGVVIVIFNRVNTAQLKKTSKTPGEKSRNKNSRVKRKK